MNENILKVNMRAIAVRSGCLERRLAVCPQSPAYTIHESKNGSRTVSYLDAKGRQRFLHSLYNPEKESEKITQPYCNEDVRYIFVIGFGMGQHVESLFSRLKDEQRLIIIEPDQSLFRDACSMADFQALLTDDRVRFIVSPNVHVCHEKIKTVLHDLFPYSAEALSYTILPFYDRWEKYSEFIKTAKTMIADTVSQINGLRSAIYERIDTLRVSGLGKQFLGEYKQCLEFLRERAKNAERLTPEEVGLLSTYFLFSHYSYAETFEKGEAVTSD